MQLNDSRLAALAQLGGRVEPLSIQEASCVLWNLENQDLESGETSAGEPYPLSSEMSAYQLENCRAVVAELKTLGDRPLWFRLHEIFNGETELNPEEQNDIIEWCRAARSATRLELESIRDYERIWPTAIIAQLKKDIRNLKLPREICLYMATYKPLGLVPAPPFGLGARIILETLREESEASGAQAAPDAGTNATEAKTGSLSTAREFQREQQTTTRSEPALSLPRVAEMQAAWRKTFEKNSPDQKEDPPHE